MSKKPTYEELEQKVHDLEFAVRQLEQTEEALKQSEPLIKAIVNASQDIIAFKDNNFIFRVANPAMCKLVGMPEDEIIGKTDFDIFNRTQAIKFRADDQHVIKTMQPIMLEEEVDNTEGVRWVSTVKSPASDNKGNSLGVVVVVRDITDRKRIEDELRENRTQLNNAQKMTHLGSWRWDLLSNKITCSDEMFRIIEVEPNAFEPTYEEYLKHIHHDDLNRFTSLIENVIRTNETYSIEYRLITSKGNIRKVHEQGEVRVDSAGKPISMFGTVHDITDRIESEQALKTSELYLKQAQSVAKIGSWHLDIKTNILTWSDETYRIFEIKREAPLRTDIFFKKVHPDDRMAVELAWQAAFKGASYDIEHRIISGEGIRWVQERAQITFDEENKPLEATGTVLDITKQKEHLVRIEHLNILNEDLLRPNRLNKKLKIITDSIVNIFKATFARIWLIKQGDLCDFTCRYAKSISNSDGCQNRDRCLHLIASSGHHTHLDGGHQRIPLGYYKIGKIASGIEPKNSTNDVANDPHIHDKQWVESLGIVSFAGHRIISPSGKVIGVLALFSDKEITPEEEAQLGSIAVTASRVIQAAKTEKDLRTNENNFRTFFNTINDCLFILDDEGNIETCNQTTIKRLGYSEEELYKKPVLFVHPESRRQEVGQIVSDMLKGKRKYCPVPLMTKNGDLIPVETYVSIGVWNRKPAIFGVSKDISKLKLSEEKFLKAFHSNPEIAGISDIDTGVYIEVNQAFLDKLGFTIEEVVGKKSTEILRVDNEFKKKALDQLLEYGSIRNKETIIYTKERQPINILLSADFIKLGSKKYNFTHAIDITELRKSELTIKKALQEKDILLREIHHRVKNNLAIITSLLNMQSERTTNQQIVEALRDTSNRVKSMVIVHESLYLSECLSEIILKDHLESIAKYLLQTLSEKNRNVGLVYDVADIHLSIDQAIPCGLIFNELITNALKYAFPDGHGAEIKISARYSGENAIELKVHDNGVGLPDDSNPIRMDSLGLYIVSILVENQLHGTLDIKNDNGAYFVVRFPLSDANHLKRKA